MPASRIVGIDLGTSNCAVAFVDPAQGADAAVADFPLPQLQRTGEVATRPLLPSCLYIPGEHELPPESTRLPWGDSPVPIAGEFARWQGARVPGRLIASAKSWLCHPGVDRTASILPWGAPAEVARLSPVDASGRLLSHIAAAWNHAHPEAPLAAQEVVVTVPASFDEVARALTVEAARRAGLENFTLVEEPQAAFYDFTARHRHDRVEALRDVRLVLVVDVGGGTSDFTLIQVAAGEEDVELRRLAVGDHLMLGGDNMDNALARLAEERLTAGGRKLAAAQWTQLVQAARSAKEALLADEAPEKYGLAVVAEGSRLLGRTLSTEISRDEARERTLEGFFPFSGPDEAPKRTARTALQELGLPYAQDPAITRHLAAFLRQHAAAGRAALGLAADPTGAEAAAGLPRPDAILLNGGVFNSPALAERLVGAVSAWWPDAPRVRLLAHDSLELAVARGAAFYGLVRRGLGRRIGGGAAHALYVGLAPAGRDEAAPRAVCLIPRGQEEGAQVNLDQRPFTLTLGQPVQFPLFSTAADRVDRPGDVAELDDTFRPLPPIHTVLKGAQQATGNVPVHLRAALTEIGTLELWCVSNTGDERWRLEFELRAAETGAAAPAAVTESMPERFGEARASVDRVFGGKGPPADPKDVKNLVRHLEKAIGGRDTWSLPLLRELWGAVHAGAGRRRRSPDHERVFFHLAGYTLRPGFGYPLDEWRCEQTFQLFEPGVNHTKDAKVWHEFWVLWRRVAGGLDEAPQAAIWAFLKPHLERRLPPVPPKNLPKPKGAQPEGLDEMVRTAASLEHLDPAEKALLGNWITVRLTDPGSARGPWAWALGRLGARVPLHGSSHRTVEPGQAADWLALLLDAGFDGADHRAFAAAQLARLTGDRLRDLDDDLRTRTIDALTAARAPERWIQMVAEVTALETADELRILGDTLPIGLTLR